MKHVTIYTTSTCSYCKRAKNLLSSEYGVTPEEIQVDGNPEKLNEMRTKTGKSSVPQIFIEETYIGGFDELSKLDTDGTLKPMLI